jgi:hypothetical protein
MPKIKYKVPISLWFVDVNQRREEENIPKEGKREKRKIEGSALSHIEIAFWAWKVLARNTEKK